MKPLILFDMDGTLIIQQERPVYTGTSTTHSSYMSVKSHMKEIVVKHGVPAELVMNLDRMAYIWNNTRHYLEDNGCSEKQINAIVDEINVPFMIEERADHAVSVLLPGTIEGLESLRQQGYRMAAVTTASRESYDRISTSEKYGSFGKYFSYSITRDDCKYIKPDPEPIHRVLEHFMTDDFIYVGDADHDAQACSSACGRFVLINTRRYDEATIESLRPDAVIDDLRQLPSALETM